jgi:drug/metabolite transporter (DMT)-like permease
MTGRAQARYVSSRRIDGSSTPFGRAGQRGRLNVRTWNENTDPASVTEASVGIAKRNSDLTAYIYVAMMILFGSMTALAAKLAVRDLPVTLVPVLRFGLAGLFMLPLVWRRGALSRLARRDSLLLLASAAFCVPINQAFFLTAARLGPTSHVGIFYAVCPLIVLMAAWAMRLERPDLRRLWGVTASVAGIVVIGVGSLWDSGGTAAETARVALADLSLVGAVLSWGGYLVVSKPLVARHGAIPTLVGTLLLGTLLALPIAAWSWRGWASLGQASTQSWIALCVLALVITPLGWTFQNLSMSRFDASQVATFSNGSPMLTIVWGVWLLGERLTPSLIVGSVLTVAGIYWASRSRRALRATARPATSRGVRGMIAPGELRGGATTMAPILVLTEEPGL